jgi:hypothetical protein
MTLLIVGTIGLDISVNKSKQIAAFKDREDSRPREV